MLKIGVARLQETVKPKKADDNKLSDKHYWDNMSQQRLDVDGAKSSKSGGLRVLLREAAADQGWAMIERVCRMHLPHDPTMRVMEVGCAPGGILKRFHEIFGYEPHGLEYAPAGVEETRRTFGQAGLDPSGIYEGDLFDDETSERFGDQYDCVVSFGLIEHFGDPIDTIRRHVEMVRPGGYLVISIPKLVGINYLTMWLFRREFIEQHNLSIMRRSAFTGLFQGLGLETLYCGHVGFFRMYGLFSRRERKLRGFAARVASKVQLFLNIAMRVGFAGRNVTWPWSPTLLFIGRKQAAPLQ